MSTTNALQNFRILAAAVISRIVSNSSEYDYLLKFDKEVEKRFYDKYTKTYSSIATPPDDIVYTIFRQKTVDELEQNITEYYTIEEQELLTESITSTFVIGEGTDASVEVRSGFEIEYSTAEEQFLLDRYGSAVPEIQISFDDPEPVNNIFQNSEPNRTLSYDSLSSILVDVKQELFTVSSTTGSATELIIEAQEQFSDVGGVVTRNRQLENTNVSEEIQTQTKDAGGVTSTVTTSGY